MTTTDNPTHNENWIALDKAQQQDATQTDILAQAIDEADAIVVGIGAVCLLQTVSLILVNVLRRTFPTLSRNIISSICCKRVCTRLIVGRNIGHLKVVS